MRMTDSLRICCLGKNIYPSQHAFSILLFDRRVHLIHSNKSAYEIQVHSPWEWCFLHSDVKIGKLSSRKD